MKNSADRLQHIETRAGKRRCLTVNNRKNTEFLAFPTPQRQSESQLETKKWMQIRPQIEVRPRHRYLGRARTLGHNSATRTKCMCHGVLYGINVYKCGRVIHPIPSESKHNMVSYVYQSRLIKPGGTTIPLFVGYIQSNTNGPSFDT